MAKKTGKHAPMMPKISEEMKEWSALLGGELATWPKVVLKPMFGMTACYRGEQIFALLPKTRGFGSANSVAFRMEKISDSAVKELKSDERVKMHGIGAKWIAFEVRDQRDLRGALEWMSRAFEQSRKESVGSRKVKGSRKSGSSRK